MKSPERDPVRMRVATRRAPCAATSLMHGARALLPLFILALSGLTAPTSRAERPPLINSDNLSRTRHIDLGRPQGAAPADTAAVSADDSPPPGPMCGEPTGPWPSEEATLLEAPITVEERNEVALQIGRCMRSVGRVADPWQVLALYRLEERLGVPDELRGILGAVWCIEGAMRSESVHGGPIRGDFDERGRAMALGPFQGHGWLWKWCGLDDAGADDLYLAARCYWSRVADRYQALQGRCGKKTWRVAEALTANGPKYAADGCAAQSGHYQELVGWRRWERRQP